MAISTWMITGGLFFTPVISFFIAAGVLAFSQFLFKNKRT